MASRLPTPGGDQGSWGDILNDFLEQSHTSDGLLKDNSVGGAQLQDDAVTNAKVSATAAIAKTKLASDVQTSLTAADNAIPASQKGAASGVASLDSSSKLTSSQLPDVVVTESDSGTTFVPPAGIRYAATKRSFASVSGGTNGTSSAMSRATWRVPVVLPVTTTRWRLHWRNWQTKQNTTPAVVSPILEGVYFGSETLDSGGIGTGNFANAPTQLITQTALPADGTRFSSAWFSSGAVQFTAGRPQLLSVGVSAGSAGPWAYSRSQYKFVASSTASLGAQTIGSFSGTFPLYGEWWIEYEFAGAEPVGLFLGDSLTDGFSPVSKAIQATAYPSTVSCSQRIAGAARGVFGLNASDVAGFASDNHLWSAYDLGNGWTPDFAVVWLGSNDVNDGRTDAQLKADLGAIYAQLQSFGIQRIFGVTILPRNFGATPEGYRTATNSWLLTRPYHLRDVAEFDRIVASSGSTTLDDARYADSDGIHLLQAGYSRVARAVPLIR